MAIVWFTDDDRQRMRAEKAERAEQHRRDRLFLDFLDERGDSSEDHLLSPQMIEMLGSLDIRPWPGRPNKG